MTGLTMYDLPKRYPLWLRLRVWLFGRAKLHAPVDESVTFMRFPVLPIRWIYLAKCPRHGYYESTLHGYKEYMNCPECEKERR